MAFKDPVREKEYQKTYQLQYRLKKLHNLKADLKALSQEHDIENYINEFILMYSDLDEFTSTINAITWYKFLINYINYKLH